MAEGGLFAWKRQKIRRNGPTADYSKLGKPLPPPPLGFVWHKNEVTREWSLVNDGTARLKDNNAFSIGNKFREHKEIEYNFEERITQLKKAHDEEHEYVEHVVLPTDTFQGICLTYKISSTRIRQVNMFSGSNLKLAPKKLIIPVQKNLVDVGKIRMQDENSKEFKIHAFLAIFPTMGCSEAKFYLDVTDYNINKALDEARADIKWEKENRGVATPGNFSLLFNEDFLTSKDEPITISVDEAVPVKMDKVVIYNRNNFEYEMAPLIKK